MTTVSQQQSEIVGRLRSCSENPKISIPFPLARLQTSFAYAILDIGEIVSTVFGALPPFGLRWAENLVR